MRNAYCARHYLGICPYFSGEETEVQGDSDRTYPGLLTKLTQNPLFPLPPQWHEETEKSQQCFSFHAEGADTMPLIGRSFPGTLESSGKQFLRGLSDPLCPFRRRASVFRPKSSQQQFTVPAPELPCLLQDRPSLALWQRGPQALLFFSGPGGFSICEFWTRLVCFRYEWLLGWRGRHMDPVAASEVFQKPADGDVGSGESGKKHGSESILGRTSCCPPLTRKGLM